MMKNPIARAANLAKDISPQPQPQHQHSGGVQAAAHVKPGEMHFYMHQGRKPVEMSAQHGMRASSRDVDRHASSGKKPRLPGLGEKGKRVKQPAVRGPARFGDQGTQPV